MDRQYTGHRPVERWQLLAHSESPSSMDTTTAMASPPAPGGALPLRLRRRLPCSANGVTTERMRCVLAQLAAVRGAGGCHDLQRDRQRYLGDRLPVVGAGGHWIGERGRALVPSPRLRCWSLFFAGVIVDIVGRRRVAVVRSAVHDLGGTGPDPQWLVHLVVLAVLAALAVLGATFDPAGISAGSDAA